MKIDHEAPAIPDHDPKDSVEDDPAVDRGERIATGKGIARGGKDSGFVAGADPQPQSGSDAKDR